MSSSVNNEQGAYSVIYQGKIAPERELHEVKQQLARLFKRTPAQLDALFSGRPYTIKKGISIEMARKYQQAMAKAGAIAEIRGQDRDLATTTSNTATPQQSPRATPQAQTSSLRVLDTASLLASFKGEISPVKITLSYRFWLLVVTLSMLVLPLVYIGVIAASIYGLYYHISESLAVIGQARSFYIVLFLYITPIIVGGIVILLMLRPFLYLFEKGQQKIILVRQKEPLLFAFVDKICQLVGASVPARIEIDSQVNASASFRRGMISFFGNDLVLTIGMPLVAGLSTRQLAGVLAHEFGHFAQGAGMRLTYVIRTINYWFTHAVYHRGSFDQKIEKWSQAGNFGVIFLIAQGFIWLVRKILWVFMIAGHAISGSMLRQMEFDADRYEIRVAGSDEFEVSTTQIAMLAYAMETMYSDLYSTWEQHEYLVDNLAESVMDKCRRLPKDIKDEISLDIQNSETQIFDTHPSDKERIDSAQHEASPGVFTLNLPASCLFSDFNTLAKRTTLKHYRDDLELHVVAEQLVPLAKIKGNVETEQAKHAATDRYFGGAFNIYIPFELSEAIPTCEKTEEILRKEWMQAMKEQSQSIPRAKSDNELWDKDDDRYYDALAAKTLLNVGFDINPRDFGLSSKESDSVQRQLNSYIVRQEKTSEKLADYYRSIGVRMAVTLVLCYRQQRGEIKGGQDMLAEANKLLPLLPRLQYAVSQLRALSENKVVMHTLFHSLDNAGDREQQMIDILHREAAQVVERLATIYATLKKHKYPFEHARGEIVLNQYLFSKPPLELEPSETFAELSEVGDKIALIYSRCVGHLAMIAEAVEHQLGLALS